MLANRRVKKKSLEADVRLISLLESPLLFFVQTLDVRALSFFVSVCVLWTQISIGHVKCGSSHPAIAAWISSGSAGLIDLFVQINADLAYD